MVNTIVTFDGKQIQLNLPEYPTLDLIYKCLQTHLPKSFDLRRHVIQLFDPTIGEFFDLNENGLKSWLCLPMKEKSQMRLQIIRAEIDNDPMPDVFQKIENDLNRLFQAIESKTKMKPKFLFNDQIFLQHFKRQRMAFETIFNRH